ncbi:hypothetical protein GCM10010385_58040 [Streptomyces geysiriensis]|nr:hypothetical protein GCM10010385_58040 [Streptomyces geysiriensis]
MTHTETSMNALRHSGDELADAVVATLFERGEVGKFNSLMRYVSTAGQELPDGLPGVAREYLRATGTPPDWVDWSEMEKARLFFIDNNVHISTALSFASMPACYVVPHVARLLSATHGLSYPPNAWRRPASSPSTSCSPTPSRPAAASSRRPRRCVCCTPPSATT